MEERKLPKVPNPAFRPRPERRNEARWLRASMKRSDRRKVTISQMMVAILKSPKLQAAAQERFRPGAHDG